jgi:HK97 gp10 family phage protein
MANDGFKMEIQGAKEIADILEKLPLKTEASILKSVNREAAKIVLEELRSNAPTSEIRQNLVIRSDREDLTGILVRPSRKIFYTRFMEYGTDVRVTESGASRGQIKPTPFIRKSINNSIGKAVKYVTENYGSLIQKHLEKAIKRVNRKAQKLSQ